MWLFDVPQIKEGVMTEAELIMFTLKVWRKIVPFCLKFLYKTRRMKAVVEAQRGNTKYLLYILHRICVVY